MATSASSATRITLRQLCSLGLPAPLLLPSLLPVVRELVPATHGAFFFCDRQGNITNFYPERMLPPARMANYHERHNNQQFRSQYLARVAAARPVSRRSVTTAERLEAYYRDVLRPLEIEHFLYAIIRHRDQTLGQLSLYRGAGQPAFSDGDDAALQSVLHYLGQAMSVPSPHLPQSLNEHVVEEGLALLTADGQTLYADDQWPRLIRLAKGNTLSPATALDEGSALPRFVNSILAAVLSSPQASHRVESAWGQFVFRQNLMSAVAGGQAVALRICRLAVEPLRLAQGAAALGLSPQQREVAVLMAEGHSNQSIAGIMGVSINTASYHAKQVFQRLGVHDRSEVAKRLSNANSD